MVFLDYSPLGIYIHSGFFTRYYFTQKSRSGILGFVPEDKYTPCNTSMHNIHYNIIILTVDNNLISVMFGTVCGPYDTPNENNMFCVYAKWNNRRCIFKKLLDLLPYLHLFLSSLIIVE